MSTRTKVFIGIMLALGLAHLATDALTWHVSDPKRFGTYLLMAILCSVLQVKRPGMAIAFSVNVPFILISMVELTLPEAVVIGCAGGLAQCLWDRRTRRHPSQILMTVAVLATIISSADFACKSLLPAVLHSETIRLLTVAITFFVVNTLPAAIATRFGRKERLGRIWKDSYFWSFPYYVVAALIAGVIHAADQSLSPDMALLTLPAVYVAYRYYRLQKSQLEEKQKHADEMAALHLRAIEGLALAVEAKDNLNTKGHLRRVQVYALEVGKELGLTDDELEALHAGALLHDIGKLAVPEHILTKPGKLTPEEFAKMKVHPVVGAEIVEQVRFPYPVAPIVRAHHEKWDGTGYPFGLKGEAIPLGARILTAVDCLDALSSDREYRRGLPLDEAMKQIISEAGTSFDPKVVKVLEKRYRDFERIAKAQLHSYATLSTNAYIPNGDAPAAGLDLCGISSAPGLDRGLDFLGTIAAARRESRFMLDISTGLGSSLDLDETLTRVEQNLKIMIPHHTFAVFIRRANNLVAEFTVGANQDLLSYLEVPVGAGLTGWVAENSNPVVNGNPAVDPGFLSGPDGRLLSALAVPLEGSQGVLGVLVLYSTEKDAFTHDHLRMLWGVTPKIGLAVENALKYREADRRANIDLLTALPNARLITEALDSELARARRLKQPLAVMFCEADGVQRVYREFGASQGDQVLRKLAQELKDDCREYDHIGRLGGEKFAIVMPGMKRESLAVKVERLSEIAAQSDPSGRNSITLGFGMAYYPDDGDSSKALLALAHHRKARSGEPIVSEMAALQRGLAQETETAAAL